MATRNISSSRTGATLTIIVASALLLLAVAMAQSQPLQDTARRALMGAESSSSDGRDHCDDWKTALAQYEANDYTHTNNTAQTFANYADRFNFPLSSKGDTALIELMSHICK